ncbi:MAG: hypothetical protein IKN87_01630 [Bacilli bacterium]|nr:hypothetical protein [Bacilli bacterium]
MKKNILFLILVVFLVTGCFDKGKIKVKFDCNGIKKTYKVKEGSVFKCNLFAENYEMKILRIEEDKFIIESNDPLAIIDKNDRIDSNSTETMFEIPKDTKTSLAVPLDGLLYTIEFEW